jgi:hypothetical protein
MYKSREQRSLQAQRKQALTRAARRDSASVTAQAIADHVTTGQDVMDSITNALAPHWADGTLDDVPPRLHDDTTPRLAAFSYWEDSYYADPVHATATPLALTHRPTVTVRKSRSI